MMVATTCTDDLSCTVALDLLEQMLSFDPATRITVPEALEHPWLAAYHDVNDEPDCPAVFDRWREIEELETIEQFREALWREVEDYRQEVRTIGLDQEEEPAPVRSPSLPSNVPQSPVNEAQLLATENPLLDSPVAAASFPIADSDKLLTKSPVAERRSSDSHTVRDPLVSYARRTSVFSTHSARDYAFPAGAPEQASLARVSSFIEENEAITGAFPSMTATRDGFVVPARSRTASMAGGAEPIRKLLRTLSTVSIYESVDGGEAGAASMARFIRERETEADAPASEMPGEFGSREQGSNTGSGKKEEEKV